MSSAERVAESILALLRARREGATICPSEVARALEPSRWRALMPRVREVAATMAAAGEVELRQRGRALSPFDEVRGPLRIALTRPHASSAGRISPRPHAAASARHAERDVMPLPAAPCAGATGAGRSTRRRSASARR